MTSRFLPGIADFSYCLNKWRYKSMTDEAIFSEIEKLGAKAFQLDFLFNHEAGESNRLAIHKRAQAAGILLTGAEYGPPSPEIFRRQVQAAQELGMTVVRHAFQPFIGLQERIPVEGLQEALRQAAEIYRGTGLRYALENHQDYTSDELLAALEMTDSPDVGIFLDTGNSIALLEDPVETARKLAPFTFGVHLKEYAVLPGPGGFQLLGVPLGSGVVDNPTILKILHDHAPPGTLPVLLENPLECCSVNLFSEPVRRILGHFHLSSLGPVAILIEQSKKLFPDGITLPQWDPSLQPEDVQAREIAHNRNSYQTLLALLSSLPSA